MPKITFLASDPRDNITVEAEIGDTILDVAFDHDIDLEHNCGGSCACTTCHVIVKEGMDNLSEMEEEEEDRLDTAEGLTLTSRLACQAEIQGDCAVKIPSPLQTFRRATQH